MDHAQAHAIAPHHPPSIAVEEHLLQRIRATAHASNCTEGVADSKWIISVLLATCMSKHDTSGHFSRPRMVALQMHPTGRRHTKAKRFVIVYVTTYIAAIFTNMGGFLDWVPSRSAKRPIHTYASRVTYCSPSSSTLHFLSTRAIEPGKVCTRSLSTFCPARLTQYPPQRHSPCTHPRAVLRRPTAHIQPPGQSDGGKLSKSKSKISIGWPRVVRLKRWRCPRHLQRDAGGSGTNHYT